MHQEVLDKAPTFAALAEECKKLKDASELAADQENLQEKLDDVEKRWSELNDKSTERETVLEKAVPVTTEYQALHSQMLPWLTEAENKADEVKLSCDPEALQAGKDKIKV